jgi:hypothetical protein
VADDRMTPDAFARMVDQLARAHGLTLRRVVFAPRDMPILRLFDVEHDYPRPAGQTDMNYG